MYDKVVPKFVRQVSLDIIEGDELDVTKAGLPKGSYYTWDGKDFSLSVDRLKVNRVTIESRPCATASEAIKNVEGVAMRATCDVAYRGILRLARETGDERRYASSEDAYNDLKKHAKRVLISDELAPEIRDLFVNKLYMIHDVDVEPLPFMPTREMFGIPQSPDNMAVSVMFSDEVYEVRKQSGRYVAVGRWSSAFGIMCPLKVRTYLWG
jgi:hypothetical protein